MARLRFVLTAQRDHYLPLRVIREHLAPWTGDEDYPQARPLGAPARTLTGSRAAARRSRPQLSAVGSSEWSAGRLSRHRTDPRLTRAELLARAGLDERAAGATLEQIGLVCRHRSVAVMTRTRWRSRRGRWPGRSTASSRGTCGAYRAAADARSGCSRSWWPDGAAAGPAARARAAETPRELAALTEHIHAALVRAGLQGDAGSVTDTAAWCRASSECI